MYDVRRVRAYATEVNPKLATDMLYKTEAKNRKINQRRVRALAGVMSRGQWELNGECIIVDDDGNVRDGQHRLEAVVRSGVTIPAIIVEGIDPSTFHSLNTGVSRTFGHAYYMTHDIDQGTASTISGATRYFIQYEAGSPFVTQDVRPTIFDCEAVVKNHPGIVDSVMFCKGLYKRLTKGAPWVFPIGAAACLHYIYSCSQGAAAADDYIEQLLLGVNIREGSAAQIVRNRLIGESVTATKRLPLRTRAMMVTKGWNATIRGTAIQQLKVGAHEGFPKIA